MRSEDGEYQCLDMLIAFRGLAVGKGLKKRSLGVKYVSDESGCEEGR